MAKITYEQMKRSLTIDKFKQISDYREIIQLGIDTKWNQLISQIPKDANVDPTDVFDEEVLLLQNLQYHGDLLTISLLSELWEQELYGYLTEKGHKPQSDYYKHLCMAYNNYTGEKLEANTVLSQMREVVNAIKHGENSINFLTTKYPNEDLLKTAWNEIDENGNTVPVKALKFNHNALSQQTLNLKGKFEQFQQAVIDFWKNLYALEDSKTQQNGK